MISNYQMRQRIYQTLGVLLLLSVAACWLFVHDPLAYAKARGQTLKNPEPTIPLACYTNTESQYNPCWACHTISQSHNFQSDVGLQSQYNFSEAAKTNFWSNAFLDVREETKRIRDSEILDYIRKDNYQNLFDTLKNTTTNLLWKPDLSFSAGFDRDGFANDNSGWRALRFKPFVGTFWPSNGSSNDVYIRLPLEFRKDQEQKLKSEIYQANLAILELAMTTPPEKMPKTPLPDFYLGAASQIKVTPYLYPQGTEFLHTVRYLDPDLASFTALRMKEVRYSKKIRFFEPWALVKIYGQEQAEKDDGRKPYFAGNAFDGLYNNFGWLYQSYIEDARGQLRLQSYEEQMSCMGCHANLGVTVDSSFAFIRKVPGAEGWQTQNASNITDVPQWQHNKPEAQEYIERAGALDEFRTNPAVNLDLDMKTTTLANWIFPSRAKALQMNKAYQILVKKQTFEYGRQVFLQPPTTLLKTVDIENTGLAENHKIFFDGRLWLDW